MADWFERVEKAVVGPLDDGWDKLDHVVTAAFWFFKANPEFVRLLRREALDGTNHLGVDVGAALRPLIVRAAEYFQRGMDEGRFRPHDPEQLIITGYGAILSYFSDVPSSSACSTATRCPTRPSTSASSTSARSSGRP